MKLVIDVSKKGGRWWKWVKVGMFPHQFQNPLGLTAKQPREVDGLITDWPEELVLIRSAKRWLAHKHFIQEHTKGPIIHTLIVADAFDNLLK